MPLSYGRTVRLIVGKRGEPGYKVETSAPIGRSSDDSFRIDFSVRGGVDSRPRVGVVQLYNPPRDLAQALRDAGRDGFVELSAGYGDNLIPLLTGEPVRDGVSISKNGEGDIILKVEFTAGGSLLRGAAIAVSLGGSPTVQQAMSAVAARAGWKLGRIDIGGSRRLGRGYSFTGTATRAFQDLARRAGGFLHYNGTTVEILDPVQAAPAGFERVPHFQESDGTLVSPANRLDTGVKFRGLLTGLVIPGRQAKVTSTDYFTGRQESTAILVRSVDYVGSTHAPQFYCDVVGRFV